MVQVLTDMNIFIKKAYISSDGGWFMDGNICICKFNSFMILIDLWLKRLCFWILNDLQCFMLLISMEISSLRAMSLTGSNRYT